MKRSHTIALTALAVVAAIALLAAPTANVFAAGSNICAGAACSTNEVGPFMSGITQACGNQGTCSLTDIQTVFINIGNWVLGVVGALVLLAYVVGGFYFLISGMPGMEKYREKGKTALKQSTVGLIIVFVAFAGVKLIETALKGGSVISTTGYYSCGPGDMNSGEVCGLNSKCTDAGTCVSQCEIDNPLKTASGVTSWGVCTDINTSWINSGYGQHFNKVSGPVPNKCPGDDDNQCFVFSITQD